VQLWLRLNHPENELQPVLLQDPPPSQGDLHFSIFGIPVRVHPFFWLVALLMGLHGEPKPLEILIWVAVVFVSILVHELGHALAALAHGFKPWITLYGMGGLASYRPTRHDPRTQILISFAGPAAGFFLIAVVLSLVHAIGHPVYFARAVGFPVWIFFDEFDNDNLNLLLKDLIFINVFWGLVNLLPVYPLDGGQISRELFIQSNPHDGARQSLWLSVFTAAGLAIFGLVKLDSIFMALLFGYLAYSSYAMLQHFSGRGGFGGPRGW
jgi:Zn-dependent protease